MLIAAYITTVVVLLGAWLWCAVALGEQRSKNERLREEIGLTHKAAADSYSEGYQKGVEASTTLLATAVVTTVGDVTKLMMGEVVGSKDEEAPERPVTDQTANPAWYQWDDIDAPIEQFGPGDSVYVPRDSDDRVASIAEGESLIPGVPLPDMTGEKFNG